jgi:NADH-quinone oxidoreductase subunit L
MSSFPLHLIPLLPLAGAAINLLLGKRLGKTVAGLIGCGAVAGAMILGWWAFWALHKAPDEAVIRGAFFDGDWIHATENVATQSLHIAAGLLLDHLSAVMVLVITTVGFLIHLYSTAYMEDDPLVPRYFGYLNLFTGSMLILVLGDSLPVTFVGWEGVGLCSYLLIGFWFSKDENAYAGRKAFIVNRIGDFGFLLGMFLLFSIAGTLKFDELARPSTIAALKQMHLLPGASWATFACLLLFIGATGKSAQIPLYVWLPDAMAGPTPVSALIHAATMVTAGVYMVARLHFLFEIDPFVLAVVASVGAITALFAATIGVTQKPIKKILAYSTVSQLGFMFVAVGTRAYGAGVFHLVTHAFFKAGLFLGAGSIMHALGGLEDVTQMGGLRKKMPITRITFLIYCLAIAGIFPFAGFFSKDAILASAFSFDSIGTQGWPHWLGHAIWAVSLSAAMLTAFYMFRAYFLVFSGEFRGDQKTWDHAHESPSAMTIPLIVLAIGSTVLGFVGIPEVMHEGGDLLAEWFEPLKFGLPMHESAGLEWGLMAVATTVSVLGIAAAWRLYGSGVSTAAVRISERFPRAYKILTRKYYVDEIYDLFIVRPLRFIAFVCWKVVDALFIDLIAVRGSALVVDLTGRALRYFQNGDVQRYIVGVVVGTAMIVGFGANWVACTAAPFEIQQNGKEVTIKPRGMPQAVLRPLEYTYDFGDGTPPESTGPITIASPEARHVYQSAGKKKISVTVHDPKWRTTSTEIRTVEIKEGGAG